MGALEAFWEALREVAQHVPLYAHSHSQICVHTRAETYEQRALRVSGLITCEHEKRCWPLPSHFSHWLQVPALTEFLYRGASLLRNRAPL